ncbi:ImmA/IrrE family metallo-endopeptidase [Hyalangium sp.]|uniref:ImmA/IrrE family metallo-endopeptidase n=1 Tax=Hyalangium sp. TaxID=2028555 RepID=UPI002D68721B|nr:ImmA/IrrE family metallo-endopeptidase [Hyalangium sp.]HYH95907.1 ImmA/IrrE family metallo-endopeptidase [Hyalangium sp.]
MSAQRRELAKRALEKALEVRETADFDDESPICVYELCEKMKIRVQFAALASMEGTYIAGVRPQIYLSSLRPLGRRAFTCGHEVGHHVFGHGSAIDELRKEDEANPVFKPDEFLVDAFSGFLLMPQVGVRNAFRVRGWNIRAASPEQVFTVACNFGVGYEALANHLGYSINEISPIRVQELGRMKLPTIRRSILGHPSDRPLIVADRDFRRPTLDAEVGTQILLPAGVVADSPSLGLLEDLPGGRLFQAGKPSLVRVHDPNSAWAIIVRIARFQYEGLARYRHVEEEEGDDE